MNSIQIVRDIVAEFAAGKFDLNTMWSVIDAEFPGDCDSTGETQPLEELEIIGI
jgi:hypothetical protein